MERPTPPMAIRPVQPAGAEVLAVLLSDALPYVRLRRMGGDHRAAVLAERIETVLRAVYSAKIYSSQNETNGVD